MTKFSNFIVLSIAAATFMLFAIAELVASYYSNSLSLFGDAVTMIVDAMTYGFNMYAEWKKNQDTTTLKMAIKLELYSPFFSVVILYIVSSYVIYDSVATLADPEDSGEVNDSVMFWFSFTNLVIDVVNIISFYVSGEKNSESEGNANMCSAMTHVIGDTLRSIAVFVASWYASTNNVSGVKADAYAAIFVSLVIFATGVPLIKMLHHKLGQLRALQTHDIEINDTMSVDSDIEEPLIKDQ